jgi:hypothetical protein
VRADAWSFSITSKVGGYARFQCIAIVFCDIAFSGLASLSSDFGRSSTYTQSTNRTLFWVWGAPRTPRTALVAGGIYTRTDWERAGLYHIPPLSRVVRVLIFSSLISWFRPRLFMLPLSRFHVSHLEQLLSALLVRERTFALLFPPPSLPCSPCGLKCRPQVLDQIVWILRVSLSPSPLLPPTIPFFIMAG